MSKRNAHAFAARFRRAGAHSPKGRPYPEDVITPLEEEIYDRRCALCGGPMGYKPPSGTCAPCELGLKPDPEAVRRIIQERIERLRNA